MVIPDGACQLVDAAPEAVLPHCLDTKLASQSLAVVKVAKNLGPISRITQFSLAVNLIHQFDALTLKQPIKKL